jgi:dolichol-phosphate mannosyltransferase
MGAPFSEQLPQLSIIVPTLNEEENIQLLISEVIARLEPWFTFEVLIVDDGSTDKTRERVQLWDGDGRVHLICREQKDGLAGAVIAGAQIARSDFVVVMDADLSHPPDRIRDLADPVIARRRDMVIGSRYVPGGTTPDWPRYRRLMSRVAAALAWPFTDVHDSLSGFFAVRRSLLLDLGTKVKGFKVGLEILFRGGNTIRTEEIPIEFRDRKFGESKMGSKVISIYLMQLAGFLASRVRRLNPLGSGRVSLKNHDALPEATAKIPPRRRPANIRCQ